MISLIGIGKSYGGKELFADVNFRIEAGDRVGMVGPNGVGKTTISRIIAREEEADRGEVSRPRGSRIGYLSQDVKTFRDQPLIEFVTSGRPDLVGAHRELERLERLVAERHDEGTQLAYAHALDHFQQLGGYSAEAEAARILSGLGFREGDYERMLHTFSGGWIMRAALARLLFQKPDLLILDEPTNHLDIPAREAVEDALADFEGTLLVVSHDRYFLDKVVTRVVEVRERKLISYPGNFTEFFFTRQALMTRTSGRAGRRRKDRRRPARTAKPGNKLAALEKQIADAEGKKLELERRVADAFTRRDLDKGRRASRQLEQLSKELDALYERWMNQSG